MDKTPPMAEKNPMLKARYTLIQDQAKRISQITSPVLRATFVSGLIELFPDDSAKAPLNDTCSAQTLTLIKKILIAPSGKVWVGQSTVTLVQALAKRQMSIPYGPKFEILKGLVMLSPEQAEADDSFGNVSPEQRAVLVPQFLREVKSAVAPIFETAGFPINVPSYLKFAQEQISRQINSEIALSIIKSTESHLEFAQYSMMPPTKVEAKNLLHVIRGRMAAQMQMPAKSVYDFWMVEKALDILGKNAEGYGEKQDILKLFDAIDATKGNLPVTKDIHEGPKKILLAVRRAKAFLTE